MTEKNLRFAEWLEKFNCFLEDATRQLQVLRRESTLKARRKRAEAGAKWVKFEPQSIRMEIVKGLGELYDIALYYSKHKRIKVKEKQKWARLAAYIAQTINVILDSYDEVMIERILDELEQYVKLHIEED